MGRSRVRTAPPIVFIGRFESRTRAFGLFDRRTGYVIAKRVSPHNPADRKLCWSNPIDAIFPSWDDPCIIGVMVQAEVVHSESNKQLIDTLRRSKLFRRYEQVFSEATGLPLALRPVDFWQMEHGPGAADGPVCLHAIRARRGPKRAQRA